MVEWEPDLEPLPLSLSELLSLLLLSLDAWWSSSEDVDLLPESWTSIGSSAVLPTFARCAGMGESLLVTSNVGLCWIEHQGVGHAEQLVIYWMP